MRAVSAASGSAGPSKITLPLAMKVSTLVSPRPLTISRRTSMRTT